MVRDTSISIRLDSQTKEQVEIVLAQFGLNMTTVVNMLFRQIVRERAIPLSLSLNRHVGDDLSFAKADRLGGYMGRTPDSVAGEMEQIIKEAENGAGEI